MKVFFKALIAVCPIPFMLSLSFAVPAAVPSSFAPALLSGSSKGRVQNTTEVILSGLKTAATGYSEMGQNEPTGIARGDFDEFNNVNDPLSREGLKAFLRISFLNDEAGKVPAMRDAPSDTGGKTVEKKRSSAQSRTAPEARDRPESQKKKPAIKKRKTVKFMRVDPLKSKNII